MVPRCPLQSKMIIMLHMHKFNVSAIVIAIGTSPVVMSGLEPGAYSVKVRPNGGNCEREIRRTLFFSVEPSSS